MLCLTGLILWTQRSNAVDLPMHGGALALLIPMPDSSDPDPDPDEFIPNITEPWIDLNDIQRRVIYPDDARRNGIEGKVVIRVLVDRNGKPIRYRADESNPFFEKAAAEAIMSATFTPAMRGNIPVKAWVSIPVAFRLN